MNQITTNSAALHRVNLRNTYNAIKLGGAKRTVLVEGDIGSGKSSLLRMFMQDPAFSSDDYAFAYFDCTTKDVGDISLPDLQAVGLIGRDDDENIHRTSFDKYVKFLPNEELKLHEGKKIVLMIDEFGKALPPVGNALLRIMLEREFGITKLPEGSIVFATTNLGAENVGDLLKPHHRNRLSIITMHKPTAEEWLEDFAIPNDLHPMTMAWTRENPAIFDSFLDVPDPNDNPYIYHPSRPQASFLTHRSMEAASDWMYVHDNNPDELDTDTLRSLLIGTIGMRGALDMMAFMALADQLPSRQEIIDDPMTAKVPTSGSAAFLLGFKALTSLDSEWATQWFKYMSRLPQEVQGMFANGVASPKYPAAKRKLAFNNAVFRKWAENNAHLFRASTK